MLNAESFGEISLNPAWTNFCFSVDSLMIYLKKLTIVFVSLYSSHNFDLLFCLFE